MDRVEDYNKFSCIRNPYIHVQVESQIMRPIIIPKSATNAWKPSAPNTPVVHKNQVNQAPASKNKSPTLLSMFQKRNDGDSKAPTKADVKKEADDSSNIVNEEQKKKKTSPVQSKSSNKASTVTKGDVKYFFAKQAEKPPRNQTKDSNSVATKEAVSNGNKEKETPKERKSPTKPKSPVKKSKSKLSRTKAKRLNANDDSDDDFTHAKKKHKRIVTMEDSDSESENEQEADRAQRELFDSPAESLPVNTSSSVEADDEDVIPPTPPVINGRKKKWKYVTKTYEDDDGFFVTKREKQFVTDSEDSGSENSAPPKAAPQAKKELPKVSPIKRKQSSLMNFFKQK